MVSWCVLVRQNRLTQEEHDCRLMRVLGTRS